MNDLDTLLDGTVSLRTNHGIDALKGPFERPLSWPMHCTEDRKTIDGTQFPELQVNDLPSITVSWLDQGIGSFDPATGHLTLPIKLGVDYPFGDATVELTLSTEADGGSPVDAASGKVKLAADGDFDDPLVLNGKRCTLLVEATFKPNPRV